MRIRQVVVGMDDSIYNEVGDKFSLCFVDKSDIIGYSVTTKHTFHV